MRRRTPVNVGASVRARLLALSRDRREDFTLTLVNYGVEWFLYRLSRSRYRDRFVLKGAMLFAVRIGASGVNVVGRGQNVPPSMPSALFTAQGQGPPRLAGNAALSPGNRNHETPTISFVSGCKTWKSNSRPSSSTSVWVPSANACA
jgi:hypothetical protein